MATRSVFVTVGTTKFDKLISTITSPDILEALNRKGYNQMVLQIGNGEFEPVPGEAQGISIDVFRFKNSVEENIRGADLVISHAGAGSCMEVLRAKKPLIVVVNEDLMDNHQNELADALSIRSFAYACNNITLHRTIEDFNISNLQPYPAPDSLAFINFLNGVMGIQS